MRRELICVDMCRIRRLDVAAYALYRSKQVHEHCQVVHRIVKNNAAARLIGIIHCAEKSVIVTVACNGKGCYRSEPAAFYHSLCSLRPSAHERVRSASEIQAFFFSKSAHARCAFCIKGKAFLSICVLACIKYPCDHLLVNIRSSQIDNYVNTLICKKLIYAACPDAVLFSNLFSLGNIAVCNRIYAYDSEHGCHVIEISAAYHPGAYDSDVICIFFSHLPSLSFIQSMHESLIITLNFYQKPGE